MTGVGLIGTGGIGRSHRRAWSLLGSTEEYGNVRIVRTAGRATPWLEVVNDPEVDIVDICAPDALHAPVVEAALEAGKRVVCEKPLFLGNRAARVAELQQRTGLPVAVCFVYRHVPAMAFIRSAVADGALGAILEVRATYLQQWALTSKLKGWRADPSSSGVLGDLGTHLVDIVRYLVPATSSGRLVGAMSDDLSMRAAWTVGGADSPAITMAVSRTSFGHANDLSVEVLGERGALRARIERPAEVIWSDPEGEKTLRVDEMSRRDFLERWWLPGANLGYADLFVHQLADALGQPGSGGSADLEDGLLAEAQVSAVEAMVAAGAH